VKRPLPAQMLIDRIQGCQKYETVEPGTLDMTGPARKEVYVRLSDVIDCIDAFHGFARVEPPAGLMHSPTLEWSEE